MLEDARKGVINLILVKDLSRLGRDFVEAGRYTDVIFPSLGVRFVSVLDCLDSEADSTDMLHFRSLMNDYHLRDLSSKVKSVLLSKKKSGQYLSAYAPYGYRKSEADKRKLVIDDYAAGIVRRIFDMRLNGMAYGKIAPTLSQEGIPTPRYYWYQQMGKTGCNSFPLWGFATVKVILHNEIYTGTTVMNQSGTRTYKDKTKIGKPEAEWIRQENAHEPIISKEVWDAVQRINADAKEQAKDQNAPTEKLFTGKLFCMDCGGRMNAQTGTKHYSTVKRYVSYHCGRNLRSGHTHCSAHRISETILKEIVTAEIRQQAQAIQLDEAAVIQKLRQRISGCDDQRLSWVQQEIKQLRRRIQELESITAKLYEDKYGGKISDSTFTVLAKKNEQERLNKAERLEALLSEVEQVQKKEASIQDWAAGIRKYLDLQELHRETIEDLIDHIEIGESYRVGSKRLRDIKVYYRFVGLVE